MEIVKPDHEFVDEIDGNAILRKIERCGRVAYKSEDKITPISAIKFVRGIMIKGHHSVIEHVNITVKFICDRGISHELVRHRLCAFTQESTRYCNYKTKGIKFISPFSSINSIKGDSFWVEAMRISNQCYDSMIDAGVSPQIARSVLPNSLKTEIVVTANLREWRHILELRTAESAHPQMRELMIPLLEDFKKLIPVIFDDINRERI